MNRMLLPGLALLLAIGGCGEEDPGCGAEGEAEAEGEGGHVIYACECVVYLTGGGEGTLPYRTCETSLGQAVLDADKACPSEADGTCGVCTCDLGDESTGGGGACDPADWA